MRAFSTDEIRQAANVLRGLSIDMIQTARSGHPGLPLGMADVAATLWLNHLQVAPALPEWVNRDRFVLSGGHGSALLYSLLHEAGYGISLDDLKQFRQLGSNTPGHPELNHKLGVEVTTGPLGQGFANGVGMALSQSMMAARFHTEETALFDHKVWVFCGDGDLEEGISHEAASFAGHLGLRHLIVLYDSNDISIEGSTDTTFTDDTEKRFRAYGWEVLTVDGHDIAAIDRKLRRAKRDSACGPVLVICRTTIGYGSPNRAGTAKSHGEPLGEEEVRLTKQALGLPPDELFRDPPEITDLFRKRAASMNRVARRWQREAKQFFAADPARAALYKALTEKTLPEDLAEKLPKFPADKPLATRAASGKVLQVLAAELPWLVGGSADLGPSNKTWLDAYPAITPTDFTGRNIHYGVREFAMAAIQNGMVADGFFLPYTATFCVFSDYMVPAMRIAAIARQQAIYVFSHDSYAVGEDGATHQPVEQLACMRATPNVTVIRPADAAETAEAWLAALRRTEGPTALLLSRQNLPVIDRVSTAPAAGTARGAYTLVQNGTGTPDLILMASGSETALALDAARARPQYNIRVVSFPSWELFEQQSREYRESVLPPACTNRISVEAGCSFGWSRYVGDGGESIALDSYGASAPAGVLAKEFGFTVEWILARIDARLG